MRRHRHSDQSAPRVRRLVATLLVVAGSPGLIGAGELQSDGSAHGPSLFPLQIRWTTDLGRGPAASPAFDDVNAYVLTRNGMLSAVRLTDGSVSWTIEQEGRFPPVAGEGVVVVANGVSLNAFGRDDGQPRWTVDLGSPVSAPLLWSSGWLIAGLDDGQLFAFRGIDGHRVWRADIGGPLDVQPTAAGGELFVPVGDGRVMALDLFSGIQRWERRLEGRPQIVLPLDAVFVGTTGNYMYRLSRESGRLDWRWRTGGDVIGAPVVDEQRIFFVSLDNILWALDRESGVQQWRRPLTGRPRAGPLLVGDVVLVSGVAARLRSFDAKTGQRANVMSAPGELGAPPYLPSAASSDPRMVLTIASGSLVGLSSAFGPVGFSLDFPPPPLLPGPTHLTLADLLAAEPLAASAPPTLTATPALPTDPLRVGSPSQEGTPLATPTAPSGRYSVQVGAFRAAGAATRLVDRLQEIGYDAYVVSAIQPAEGLQRVRVGRFLTREEAIRIAGEIEPHLADEPFVVRSP